MKISFREIPNEKTEYNKLKELYQKAFPKDERLPLWILKIKSKRKSEFFYSIYDEEKFIGLIYLINNDNITYVLYLAIDSNNRGKGYGSIVLDKIKEESGQESVVLCIEEIDSNADNYEQRIKRKKFYEKNGFRETGYKNKEGKRFYEILTYGKKHEKQKYEKMMKNVWGNLWYTLFGIKVEEL